MRVLNFAGDEDGKRDFWTLWIAFLNGPGPENREEVTRIVRVQQKLEDASEERTETDPDGKSVKVRALLSDGATLRLEDAEHDFLRNSLERWLPKSPRAWARRIEQAFALLDGAAVEKIEPVNRIAAVTNGGKRKRT